MKAWVTALCFFVSMVLLAAETVPPDIQQPGTQPTEIGNLESPDKCDNCHGGYNSAVEPAHNWRGSMMAHAGRDPIFWATLAIAEQDFDGAGDLCIRCHSTGGWLAGRSTPTDGSGLAAGDSDGVECDFCHKMTNPDNSEHAGNMFGKFVANEPEPNNDAFFDWDPPHTGIEGYLGSGMAAMWGGSDKLGPYNNAEARHQFMESAFHRDRDFCGTCHDVSNPVTGNLAHNHGAQSSADPVVADDTLGGSVDGKAAFNNPPYKYGIVERTFSEYKAALISQTLVSDYPALPADLKGGALEAVYNAATLGGTTDGNYQNPPAPRYFSCQTCHLRPVIGEGANKRGVPERIDLPLHDMTGGNYWMPEAIEYLNAADKLRLGGGMSALQITALRDGALRAKEQLELAASLSVSGNGNSVKVVNHTGHKLISGYPEGRRMWLNIKWYDSNGLLLREDGEYGEIGVSVDGKNIRSLVDLNGTNTKIYEAHMGMTQEWARELIELGYPSDLPLSYERLTGDPLCRLGNLAQTDGQGGVLPPCDGDPAHHETFHFVLNNTVVSDNRIPPYGMDYELARMRNALPVPADQYGGTLGGTYDYFDDVTLNPPSGAQSADINLMYQPTSWEYIQFLYLANNGPDPAAGGNAFLGDEGANLLESWLNTGMAEPYVMASATWGTPPTGCTAVTPTLLSVEPADKQITATWSEITSDPDLLGYKLYYDQAGKAQLVTDVSCPPGTTSNCTTYSDDGLTNGQEYCYKATSYSETCESGFSDILCAVPIQPGQEIGAGVIAPLQTGKWVTEGRGKKATTTFVSSGNFVQGDEIVIRATVEDESGTAVPDAVLTISVGGPDPAELTSAPSDAGGIAEAVWSTQRPNKKGSGGTQTGTYTATVTGLTASGFVWDQVTTSVTIEIGPLP